jgi:hypothetical protein
MVILEVSVEEDIKALQIRFPIALYNLLSERADKSRRSLNAEVIVSLEEYLTFPAVLAVTSEKLSEIQEKLGVMEEFIKANPKKK